MLKDWLARLLRGRGGNADEYSQGYLPRRRSTRNYYARSRQWLYILAACVLTCVLVYSAAQLISYATEYFAAKRVSDELREIYYASDTTDVPSVQTQITVPTSLPDVPEATMAVATDTPLPATDAPAGETPRPALRKQLEPIPYPGNPFAVVNDRFKALQKQNKDIIGWLKADYLIDEAVVQRDNTYYLDRDYLGYHNKNGALFLDENCSLKTRPYTLMIFGHNMQSGAMFGVLRNYENRAFLLKNPFITFDTAYEKGRYVIFAVGTISTNMRDDNFVNLAQLNVKTADYREETIAELQRRSVYTGVLDVKAEDQLLLLVTCVDDPDERRIVCARRVRDGESEDELIRKLEQMWKK